MIAFPEDVARTFFVHGEGPGVEVEVGPNEQAVVLTFASSSVTGGDVSLKLGPGNEIKLGPLGANDRLSDDFPDAVVLGEESFNVVLMSADDAIGYIGGYIRHA